MKVTTHVYQRSSDKRWVGVAEVKTEPGAKRNRKVVYGKSEGEVWEKVNLLAYELQTGEYVAPSKETLVGYLKSYHGVCAGYDAWDNASVRPEKAKWDETTAELYKMYIDVHFEPYFKDIKLKDIKPSTLDTFYNYKITSKRKYEVKQGKKTVTLTRNPLSINTVIKLNKFLSAAFNYAVANDLIKKNPTKGVVLDSPERFIPTIYDKEKFLNLLEVVYGKDEEVPVILGAGCGLRRGEMCGLTWGNVDFERKVITIVKNRVRFTKDITKDPKNEKSQREIIAPDYVIDTLQRHYYTQGRPPKSERVITRWKPQSLSKMFTKLLKKNGLEPIRLHDLRHYNATIMLKNKISDKVAAERLGHSNVSTLREVYQHVLEEMDEEAANMINESITPIKQLTKEEKRRIFKIV